MKRQGITGIYCLANDAVLDWIIAFLESLRAFEPERELIIIPYSDNIAELSKLSVRYRFTFLNDHRLRELEQLGAKLIPDDRNRPLPIYRKLAVFWGPFDQFLFMDADIIVLGRLDEIFAAYQSANSDFMYFDRDLDMAYRAGAFQKLMIQDHSAVGFNAGAFVSSKNTFSFQEFQELAEKARFVCEDFVNFEQSFLNYCVDMKGLIKDRYCDLVPSASCSNWAKLTPIASSEGVYRHFDSKQYGSGRTLLFIHWAGFKPGPLMPHRKLFLNFRHKDKPRVVRFAYYGLDFIFLFWVLLQAAGRKVYRSLSQSP